MQAARYRGRCYTDQHLNGPANSCDARLLLMLTLTKAQNVEAMGPQLTAGYYTASAIPSACVVSQPAIFLFLLSTML
jgi:hypothetical protein